MDSWSAGMILERFYATQLSAGEIGKTGCEEDDGTPAGTPYYHMLINKSWVAAKKLLYQRNQSFEVIIMKKDISEVKTDLYFLNEWSIE